MLLGRQSATQKTPISLKTANANHLKTVDATPTPTPFPKNPYQIPIPYSQLQISRQKMKQKEIPLPLNHPTDLVDFELDPHTHLYLLPTTTTPSTTYHLPTYTHIHTTAHHCSPIHTPILFRRICFPIHLHFTPFQPIYSFKQPTDTYNPHHPSRQPTSNPILKMPCSFVFILTPLNQPTHIHTLPTHDNSIYIPPLCHSPSFLHLYRLIS